MIESVQARQRGAFQFEEHYDNLCALQDTAPLSAVKAHLEQGVIDLNGDRIRLNDWAPILNTIRINKSLQFIAVRSYYQLTVEDDEKRSAILKRKLPSIRSKEITHRLCKALKECMFVSPSLSCIELQGLALRDRDLQVLVKGIHKSRALRHLSLETGRIGDQGLEILCKGLKNSKHINSVNLSGCSLSPRGAECLAAVIKHQGMQRHNEAWRDSLRYRRPDLDRMAGLRRITINNNPMLGDDGARMLAEALKDDLWLKALDLQGCGVSTAGARSFLDVLKYNTTLVVLDLRRNPLVDRDILHSLMEQLMLNSNGEDGEYKWMKATSTESLPGGRGKRRTTKVLNASGGKKTTIKILPGGVRRKNKNTPITSRQARLDVKPSPGLPWRTAARANRFRGHPPEKTKFLDNSQDVSSSVLITSTVNNNNSMGVSGDDDDEDDTLNVVIENENASSRMKRIASDTAEAMRRLEESHLSMDLTNEKEVLIELEQMRRHLREERLARAKADQRVMALMIENRRLTEELERVRKTQQFNSGIANDEAFLDSIESSFKQFHAFIDMLREAGLGQLVSMAGLDQASMLFPLNGSSNNSNNNNNNNNNGGNFYSKTSSPSMTPAATTTKDGIFNPMTFPPPASSSPSSAPQDSWKAGQTKNTKPMGEATPFSATFSTTSFSEQPPIVVGAVTQEGDWQGGGSQPSHLEKTKDAAKKEADELYSRLIQDTHGTLTPGASKTNEDNENDKYMEAMDIEDVEEFRTSTNKIINKSYEDQSSFVSDQDISTVRDEKVSSVDAGDGSDNDDF